jgi:hypothetical protein
MMMLSLVMVKVMALLAEMEVQEAQRLHRSLLQIAAMVVEIFFPPLAQQTDPQLRLQ